MDTMIKCKRCGGEGFVVKVDDLYYARCHDCHKWLPYEFLGITPQAAIRNWNEGNKPLQQGSR